MKSPKQRARRAWWIVLAVMAAVGIDAVVRTEPVERVVAAAVESALGVVTGEQVLLGDLELNPVALGITVKGLIVSHESGQSLAEPVVTVDELRIALGLPIDGAWIRKLEVDRPVISLHVDEDGLREFRDARASGGQKALPWRQIEISNARLELDTPVGRLLLEGMDAETRQGDEVDITVQTARLMAGGIDEVARTVEAQRVRLSPNGIVVPQFNLESEHSTASGSIDAEFGGALRGEVTASVAFSVLNALVSDAQQFEGTGHLDVEFGGTVREPMAEGIALVQGFQYANRVKPEKPRTVLLNRMTAPIRWSGSRLVTTDARLEWADGTVMLNAALNLSEKTVDLTAMLEAIDLRTAIRESGGHKNSWVNFRADGELGLSGTFGPLNLSGEVDLATADFEQLSGAPDSGASRVLIAVPSLSAAGSVDVRSDGIWLNNISVNTWKSRGALDAFIGFQRFGPLDVRLNFDRLDLSDLDPLGGVALRGVGQLRGRVAGEFRDLSAHGTATMRRFGLAGLYFADNAEIALRSDDFKTIEFPRFEGVLGSTRYEGAGELQLGGEPFMDFGVDILEGRIGDLVRIGDGALDWVDSRVSGALTLVGDPAAFDGEFALDFRDVDLLGEAFPAGSATGWWDARDVRIDRLQLARWNGAESVLVQGSVTRDWDSNLAVAATGFDLGRLRWVESLDIPAQGTLSLDAVLRGSLFEPKPKGRVALRDTTFAGQRVPDSTVSFEQQGPVIALNGALVGNSVTFEGSVDPNADRLFAVDAELKSFPLHSVFPIAADGAAVRSMLTGSLEVVGDRAGSGVVYGIRGSGQSLSVEWDRHRLASAGPWQFESSGQSMSLKGFRMLGPGTDVFWNVESDAMGQLNGEGGGVVDADLARMAVTGLERAEGPVALDVGVSGTVAAPEWSVRAALAGVTVQGEWFPHPVEEVYGIVDLRSDQTRFRRLDFQGADADWLGRQPLLGANLSELARHDGLHGVLGDGTAIATGGFTAEHWLPTQWDIQGEVVGARIQFIEELPPTKGNASLSFTGPANEALLAGSIDVTEMLFNERITWEEWMLEFTDEEAVDINLDDAEPLFAMDIVLRSDNTIQVRNNVGYLTAGGELRIVGDTIEPGLLGSVVAVPGGRMHLKEREFELTRGEILYVDPNTFDPQLDLVLNTEVRSREETYDVTYRVGGTLDDWVAETRSEPALPAADVNALLLFGMTRAELERYGGLAGALAIEGGDLLASSFLFSPRDDTERGGLFRIVDPLRPERLDLVSGVSERGSGLVNSELRLLYENELSDLGLNGSMMILEQNISRASDTYLGFEQRLARQLYARTYWGSEQVGRFLDVGGAYGLEMKVRWELD
ncbi:MAG: translocation/assembly module TamB domain-containing protein [Myxococcota bacterium]|nr:translocation/assembly module TamB domain-containing protein [Myxococcota bacterium]